MARTPYIFGRTWGYHKNGNRASQRWYGARGSLHSNIKCLDTKISISMNNDASGDIIVERDGKTLWLVQIGPEKPSALQLDAPEVDELKTP